MTETRVKGDVWARAMVRRGRRMTDDKLSLKIFRIGIYERNCDKSQG